MATAKGKSSRTPRAKRSATPSADRSRRAPTPAQAKNTFDVIPGTSLDEHAAPWIVGIVLVPLVGTLAHRVWGGTIWAWVVLLVSMVTGAGLAWASWHESRPRTIYVQVRITVSVFLALASVGVTTVTGMVSWDGFTRPWADIYVWTMAAACLSWNIRRTEAMRGYGQDTHARPEKVDDSLATAVGIGGAKARVTHSDADRVVADVDHPGYTHADVSRVASLIASVRRLPPDGVRFVGKPRDGGASTLYVESRDALLEPVPWPGPSQQGGSVIDGARIGTYSDFEPLVLVRPGLPNQRASASFAVQGQSGSGKSNFGQLEVLELATRDDVLIWWSDIAKGARSTRDIGPALDWFATTLGHTKIMISAIAPLVTARSAEMAKYDFDEWTPEVFDKIGMPYLVFPIEEAAALLGQLDDDAMIRAGEQIRSAGISLSVSAQRWSASNIPTDLRANMGGAVCFGVKDAVDATMVLSEVTLERGADPSAWGTAYPGKCYLEAPSVDELRWSTPARTFSPPPPDQAREHIEQWARNMARIDPVTLGAIEHIYTGQGRRFAVAVTRPGTLDSPEHDVFERPDPSDDEEENPEAQMKTLRQEMSDADPEYAQLLAETEHDLNGQDSKRLLDIDPASVPEIDFSDSIPPGAPLSPAERDQAFAGMLGELLDGRDDAEVTTDELVTAWYSIPGMTASQRPALTRRLRKLAVAGHVDDEGRGKWRVHASAVRAAVGAPADSDDEDDTESDDE